MAENLAPLFVNHNRVRVQGDPRPTASKIIESCGKEPAQVQLYRLSSEEDKYGEKLELQEVIDRESGGEGIWFRLAEARGESTASVEPSMAEGPTPQGGVSSVKSATTPQKTNLPSHGPSAPQPPGNYTSVGKPTSGVSTGGGIPEPGISSTEVTRATNEPNIGTNYGSSPSTKPAENQAFIGGAKKESTIETKEGDEET